MPIGTPGRICRVLALLFAGPFAGPVALAQTAAPPPGQPAADAQPAPTREDLQKQLDAQNARNDQLRQRLARLEELLKTDVCNNPEAAALLKAEQQPSPPR